MTPGNAERQEHHAPVVMIVDDTGDVGADPGADRRPERKHGERHRPLRGREIVRDDRAGARRAARLADADADARQQQLHVVLRQAAARRHHRPRDQAERDDVAPVAAVDQPGDREAEHDVEQRQRHAGEERDAGIGQLQLEPDRFEHRRDHVAVGDAERVDEHHHQQHVPALHDRAHPAVGRLDLNIRGHSIPRDLVAYVRLSPGRRDGPAGRTRCVSCTENRSQIPAVRRRLISRSSSRSRVIAPIILSGPPIFFACSRGRQAFSFVAAGMDRSVAEPAAATPGRTSA